jgi:ABC-type transport system substrate-binding protein
MLLLWIAPSPAQRLLTIGAQSASLGMDPHYHSSNPNDAILRQIFETLVDFDNSGRLLPRLAESWRAIDDLTWEFRLRDGVKFHDGTPLSAEDITFSYARVPTITNSTDPFNRQHYSNPAMDAPLAEALRTMDPTRRNALTAQAMRIGIEDGGVIPIFYLKVSWAGLRNKVKYDASPSWYTNALLASPP